jgi:GNAT superfamily N-acetyltransferase
MECTFIQIDSQSIDCIRSLWDKLNRIHLEDSHYFKEHYQKFSFEKRCEKFNLLSSDDIFIEGIFSSKSNIPVGYCISTVDGNVGEIDSLFVEENYRKHGYGTQLVEHSLKWLKNKKCISICVAVAEGNESVYGFYQRFGFYPRLTYLQYKEIK